MLKLLIRLSALSLGLSYVACSSSSQSQLASLNERMNQMLSALYASPLLSKQSSTEESSDAPETSYIVTSGPPQVVFVAPSPYLEAGAQPNDHAYPTETHPVARSAWPYPYDYSYPQYPVPRYPEARPSYTPIQTSPFPSAYSPVPYSPSPYPPPAPIPSYQPFAATPGPYPQMYQVQPQYPPVPHYSLPSPIPSYPVGYPSPYPVPAQQFPGYPAVLPGVPQGYPALPAPFPSQGYLTPGLQSPYPPAYPPAYPKYSEVLRHPSPFDFNKI